MSYYPIPREGRVLSLEEAPWKEYACVPRTTVRVSYDEEAFALHFVSYETELRAKETQHNTPVCCDSCMEAFLQFAPATDPHYINIEVNPNAAVYCAVRTCREDEVLVEPEVINALGVRTHRFDDRWEVDLRIPAAWIRRFIPTYRHGVGTTIRANFYKCGDETAVPHYGAFAPITWEHPDFHRPEFFADFILA